MQTKQKKKNKKKINQTQKNKMETAVAMTMIAENSARVDFFLFN